MASESLERVDGLWFKDDTVILRAENKVFRVSQSILAARSPVFGSMFALPQPPSDDVESLDGTPVVRLQDSAADIEAFLRAIFDPSYFMPPPAAIEFHQVLGILRLSHKYDVDYLFKRALLHLEIVYPCDISQLGSIYPNSLGYTAGQIDLDLKAIPLLQGVGAFWLLPFAFYSLGTYSLQTLLAAGDSWDVLPPETKQMCMLIPILHVRMYVRIQAFLLTISTCNEAEECNSRKAGALKNALDKDVLAEDDQDPFLDLIRPTVDGWRTDLADEFCDDCFQAAQEEYHQLSLQLWNELRGNCGLVDWMGVLEKRRQVLE